MDYTTRRSRELCDQLVRADVTSCLPAEQEWSVSNRSGLSGAEAGAVAADVAALV